jgi:hypothetical protein
LKLGFAAMQPAPSLQPVAPFVAPERNTSPVCFLAKRKTPRLGGGFPRAADGIRTHDLLHGKRGCRFWTLAARPDVSRTPLAQIAVMLALLLVFAALGSLDAGGHSFEF